MLKKPTVRDFKSLRYVTVEVRAASRPDRRQGDVSLPYRTGRAGLSRAPRKTEEP